MTGAVFSAPVLGLVPVLPRFFQAARRPAPNPGGNPMLTTIQIAGHVLAQGLKVAELTDGRVTIETGRERVTGWPVPRVPKSSG